MKVISSRSFIKLIILFLFCTKIHAGTGMCNYLYLGDSLTASQKIYNGRIWRDLYAAIEGDQFFFSGDFLQGDVTMNGNSYNNLKVRYDIMNDEIITITDKGLVIQLNKEMVDGFTLKTALRNYNFLHVVYDSVNKLDGYFHVMYNGKTSLYVMYCKEISERGPGKSYEDFVQYDRIFIIKDNIFHQVRNKGDFKKVVSDRKQEIKEYIRKNGLKVNRKVPDSFVPVLQYYDSLIK